MKKLVLFLSFLFVISCSKDPIIYTLTTSANPAEGGTVSPSTQQYDEGETATITATPSSEYVFQSWSGATGSTNSTSVVMNSDKSVTANFVKKKYSLNVMVEGEGTVSEKVIKTGAATDYNSGTIVELTAVPSGEWLFVEWKGDVTGTENPTQITIDKAKNVTAVFVKKQYPLTIEIEGEGTVTEKVIKAGVATDYNSGTIIELTAEPTGDWKFMGWSGDVTGTENPTEITIDKAKNVTAVFVKKLYLLTIEIEGEGTVSEKVIKAGVTTEHTSGTIIELTAEPTGDWEFVEWTGDITSTENPVQITIDEAKNVNAKFMRYFDYKVPSYVWKNNIQPRFNLGDIEKENGLDPGDISDTGSAYADFNGDGYFDIMSQGTAPDGTYVGYDFFINNGDDTFEIDNSFFNSDFQSDKARKTIVGDFNGDNKPDVVRISGQHDYLDNSNITLSKSDGSYIISKIEVVPVTQYHGFASGDIDNDGDLDLFFGSPGKDQGFALNNGDGTFIWKKSTDVILNQTDGPREQVQTVEIFDFNNDNNLDLIIGGQFNDTQGQPYLDGPSILWGDGTGYFDFNNKSEVFNFNQKPTTNTGDTCNLDDFVFGDINGDGLNEIILMFYICMDVGWGSLLEIYSPNSNFEFKRVTESMLPDNIVRGVWLQLRDIDNNNKLDIVETELPSWRYEWNGSRFEKIN